MREAKLGAAIGFKGVGKTYNTRQRIMQYVRGNPEKGVLPRKWLIVDVNEEFGENDDGFAPIRAIALGDVYRFANAQGSDVRRVRMFKSNGQKMGIDEIVQTLYYVLENYRSGGLLIEDISKYISDQIPKDVIGSICTQRHMDCDIILHFQIIGKILHPKIWANLNYVRLHKYKGSVKAYKNELKDSYEVMLLAETLVNNEYVKGNSRFHCFVDFDRGDGVIYGEFSQDDFIEAIDRYIQQNYRQVVNPVVNERDVAKGELVYTPETAIEAIRDRLYRDYYGN